MAALLAIGVLVIGTTAMVALQQRDLARAQQRAAQSREYAAQAMAQPQIDPQQSISSALKALTYAPTGEAWAALRSALSASHAVRQLDTHTLFATGVAFSADGAMQTRKQYSPAFKAQLVQERLREEKTVAQLAAEHGIHPTQLHKWRSIALEGLPELFSRSDSTARLRARYEEQLEELYAQLERVTTQLAWLKRRVGLEPGPH